MSEGTFTQETVNAMVGSARTEAREKATREAAEKYGTEIAQHKAEAEKHAAKVAELSKAVGEFDTLKTTWEAEKKTLAEKAAEAETLKRNLAQRDFEDTLVAKGVKAQHKADMRILLEAKGALVGDDGKPLPIDKVLESAKTTYSQFFAESDTTTKDTTVGTRRTTGDPPAAVKTSPFDR